MGQYEAGVHAQNILRKIMNRSDMGSVVNESNGKWINGRKRIGSYNMGLLENIDYTDSNTEYRFELGFNNFINTLNEHYHVDGYYIDSSGRISGDIYVCEEAEDDEVYMVNPLTDDVAYIQQEAVWQDYLINKARLEKNLRTAVSEALIISDERMIDKVDRLLALQEGLGDTLSDGWTKFKNFIAKLWQKFTEFISRTLNNDKSYLTKYKEIILHREVTLGDITFEANYTQGEKNITQFTIYTPSSSEIDALPPKNEGDAIKTVQRKLFPPYGESGSDSLEFNDFCTRYFKGGKDEWNVAGTALNMASMFNWCYNFDKIEKKINKDRTIFDTAFRNFENKAKDLENKQKAVDVANARKTDTVGLGSKIDTTDLDNQIATAKTNLQTAKTNKDNALKGATKPTPDALKQLTDKVTAAQEKLNELERRKQQAATQSNIQNRAVPNSGEAIGGKTQATHAHAILTTLGIPITEANVQIGNKKTGSTATGGSQSGNLNLSNSAVKTRDVGDDGSLANASDMDALKERLSMYCTTSQIIFASLLSAAQAINKGYMQVIKAHVQSYAGNMEDSVKTAGQAAANHTQTVSFNTAQTASFKARIEDIKKMDEGNEKTAAIANLLFDAGQATAVEPGKPRRTFASISDLESFLAGQQTPSDQTKANLADTSANLAK